MNIFASLKDVWNKLNYILNKSQKKWGFVVLVGSILGAFIETIGVSVIFPFIQTILIDENEQKNSIAAYIAQMFGIDSSRNLLVLMTFFVVLTYFVKNAYLTFLSYVRSWYSNKIYRELSIDMVNAYSNRGYNFFKKSDYSIFSRGVNGVVGCVQSVIYNFFKIFGEILTVICILIFIALTDFFMFFVLLLVALISLILILYFFKNLVKKAGEKSFEATAGYTKWLYQFYNGIKEILVLKNKKYFIDNYTKELEVAQKANVVSTVSQESPAYVIELTCVIGLLSAICIRIQVIDNPIEYIARLATFAMAAFRIMPSLGRISSNYNSIVYYIPGVNEAYDNMVLMAKNMNNLDKSQGKSVFFEKQLQIKALSFKYEDAKEKILNNININIKKGESIAFVGASGTGKTTLADIILGLYAPLDGEILIDNQSIDTISNRTELIGFVPQNVYLIDDTIRRNVAFGIADECIDDEKVCKALKQAQILTFVENLENGMDTIVGDRGVRFSGGQAQRLAIARALYNDPEIIVLDEATSALDTETEQAVMDAINELQGKKTLIIIAHRLTTIKNCDHIYEIKYGSAIERQYKELI